MTLLKNAVLLLIHIVMVWWVHNEGDKFYTDRIQQGKINPKVYDIGLKYIPNLSSYTSLQFLSNFVALVLPFLFGSTVVEEYLEYSITLYLIRYITTSLTILPKDKNCDSSKLSITNYIFGHCYDKIFSGHFSSLVLLSYIIYSQNIITNIPLLIILNVLNGILILAVRYHYTIDLVVGFLVVTLVFQNKLKILDF